MVLKLVYYGPALSGKTTNLLRLNDLLALSAAREKRRRISPAWINGGGKEFRNCVRNGKI
jgi:hypothetical protein